ncbi:PRC-barrel domain-containing protein [Halomonas sp. TRM85114]|nr:PRC-barrel domain-containing protein [Halomonas jincaotanensis]
MTAESLMDTEVLGSDDEEIGSVENILLNDKNEIVAIIAQVGGLWDIGDTHVLVPWEEVEVNEDGVSIPVHEDNADDYGLFDEDYVTKEDLSYISQIDDDATAGSRLWKLTDLLDDYASVGEGNGYGYVDNPASFIRVPDERYEPLGCRYWTALPASGCLVTG